MKIQPGSSGPEAADGPEPRSPILALMRLALVLVLTVGPWAASDAEEIDLRESATRDNAAA